MSELLLYKPILLGIVIIDAFIEKFNKFETKYFKQLYYPAGAMRHAVSSNLPNWAQFSFTIFAQGRYGQSVTFYLQY